MYKYKINPPHGVWRQLTRLYSSSPPNTNFLYSDSPTALSDFVERESISSSLSGGIAKPSDSEMARFRDSNFNVWRHKDSYILHRSELKDTNEGYYLGWFELPDTVDLHDLQTQLIGLPLDFTQIQKLPYIDIYSSRMPGELSSWYNDNKSKEFKVVHKGASYRMTLHSPICPMCYGIHRECPLKTLRPTAPIPRKRSTSDDDGAPLSNSGPSSAANSSKQRRTAVTYLQRDSLLVRDELVKSVVERVEEDHFLLVSYDLTNDDYL